LTLRWLANVLFRKAQNSVWFNTNVLTSQMEKFVRSSGATLLIL
jgi:hypothetical protein